MKLFKILILLLFVSVGCTQNCDVTQNKTAYTYYLWGQSNMVGITDGTDWGDIILDHKVFNGVNFEAQQAEDWNNVGYSNSGIELELSDRLASLHPNGEVFIIKRAKGSTSVAWHWNVITSTSGRGAQLISYKNDIDVAHAYLEANGYTIRPQKILSFIGETDSASPASAATFAVNYTDTSNSIMASIGEVVPITAYRPYITPAVQVSFPFPHLQTVWDQFDILKTNGVDVIKTDDVEHANDGIHVTRNGFRALENKGI